MNHNFYMQRAIELAKMGLGNVSPNPMVGAVVVYKDKIIGEGFHEKYGENHAEVNAINDVFQNYSNASELLKQSTIYVTLEPCAHYGKTPPCADFIIKHQIKKVIIGCTDSNELVKGRGIEKLLNHSIKVEKDVLKEECIDLNKRFFTAIHQKRPYIILKWAQSCDGFIAPKNPEKYWLTNDLSKIAVHKWRSEEDCILVGYQTALFDNPELNVRYWNGRNPARAFIDNQLSLPNDFNLLNQNQKTYIFNYIKTDFIGNNKYLQLESGNDLEIPFILYNLYLNDIQSVIIEGGAKTLNKFINLNLWDEARIFTVKQKLYEGIVAPKIFKSLISEEKLIDDKLSVYRNL